MIVGRVFIVLFVLISIFWIPIIELSQGSRLFDYIQSVTSFLAPPVCAVYVQAILFKRINEPGSFWGLIIGLGCGLFRFIWQFTYTEPSCIQSHLDKRPAFISKVHFLHYGIILFVITCISSWAISLLTPPIPDRYIRRLTYFSIDDEQEPEQREEETNESSIQSNENKKPGLIRSKSSKLFEKLSSENLSRYGDSSKWKKSLILICGIENFIGERNQQRVITKINTSIGQEPFLKAVCDVNAVVAIALCGFSYAFFNKFN